MKAKSLIFILLALCLVLALTSCDGGGGGGGGNGDSSAFDADFTAISGGSNTYVIKEPPITPIRIVKIFNTFSLMISPLYICNLSPILWESHFF